MKLYQKTEIWTAENCLLYCFSDCFPLFFDSDLNFAILCVVVFFQYVEEDELVDAIKALSSVKKEHTMFTDTHL